MVTKYRGNILVTKHRKTVLIWTYVLWLREVKHYEMLEYSVVKVIGLITSHSKRQVGYLVSSGSTGMVDVTHGDVMSHELTNRRVTIVM